MTPSPSCFKNMIRNSAMLALASVSANTMAATKSIPSDLVAPITVNTSQEPVIPGKFDPTWKSLEQYQVPDWFRDAKFGIWAHWGPQCAPEEGDWYARDMYFEGNRKYKAHLEKYGHPSEFGFKDVINSWKAEKWDPEKLVAFYKDSGAKYFFAMANHHDNLDMWDSQYQPWNSVRVGPQKNLIAGWVKAARNLGLPFGVSVHASHAWTWYEPSQLSDKSGPRAGVPYDGKLTKADGKGKWWDGLDPQELYAQNHPLSVGDKHGQGPQWNWGEGASQPDQAYCDKFYNRTMDLIKKYQPELIYFDDTALPLWPVSDAGLKIAASFYNLNRQRTSGKSDGVLFGKILTPDQRKALVWDIEAGVPDYLVDTPWQTCTCLGSWHYYREYYDKGRYKSARTVIHMLADIVSKNGNLLLSVPVRGDGSIDDKEVAIVKRIGEWLKINGEAIYGTRPWKVFGEGPAGAGSKMTDQGLNEGKGRPFSPDDVRYTVKDGTLYVISLGRPTQPLHLVQFGTSAGLLDSRIAGIRLLGSDEQVKWNQTDSALVIDAPKSVPTEEASVFAVSLAH